jgi:8-oxo-dGTP pyrophosphatase MutT (NUDIX family)
MIQIYVGDKPIMLTDQILKEDGFKNYLIKSAPIGNIIKQLNVTKLKSVHLIHPNKDQLLPELFKLLPIIRAAGGKVIHKNKKVLFIYRNDKWDLPKGRIEKNESLEKAAMREIEEETGVSNLSITRPLQTTYHIFKRNGKHALKETFWFEMKTNFNGALVPEKSEGITKVEWLDNSQIEQVLSNSYANIKVLL